MPSTPQSNSTGMEEKDITGIQTMKKMPHICCPKPNIGKINNAVQTRKEWLNISKLKKQKKKADAFDRHFKTMKQSTQAFCKQAHLQHKRTIIDRVEIKNGTLTDDANQIAEAHIEYWRKLFSMDGSGTETPPSLAMMDNISQNITSKITTQQAAKMEKPVETEEALTLAKALPAQKAAGPDGLRAEVFK